MESWIDDDYLGLACSGSGILEVWKPLEVRKFSQYMKDWTSYSNITPWRSFDEDTLLLTALNLEGVLVELKADLDPVVLSKPDQSLEYYFNVWERPANVSRATIIT